MAKTASQIKEEALTEIRNIIHYRQNLVSKAEHLDYEELQKEILSFAGAVYHFKERLANWVKKCALQVSPSISEIAESNQGLLVCGDLFNYKKHGGNDNRSKLSPCLSEMQIHPGDNPVGIKFDGIMKTGQLDRAVPYSIEIYCSQNRTLGNAVSFISKCFYTWVPIMVKCSLLDPKETSDAMLIERLSEFDSNKS